MPDLTLKHVTGDAIRPWLDELAALRIEVFREFPYLYDGDLDYERRYLTTYATSPEALFVLALDGDRLVGVSTGVPLLEEDEDFRRPFDASPIDPAEVFYFGESVIARPWRGRGTGGRFFDARETYARDLGRFAFTAFAAVERPTDHPRRPRGYTPLDAFWRRRGYQRHPELRTTLVWKDLDEAEPSPKPMVFWLKPVA